MLHSLPGRCLLLDFWRFVESVFIGLSVLAPMFINVSAIFAWQMFVVFLSEYFLIIVYHQRISIIKHLESKPSYQPICYKCRAAT